MRLADLVHPGFRLVDEHGELDLAHLEAHARDIALPDAAVVEVPARDPREALIHLEAAWQRNALPVPNARTRTPAPLPAPAPAPTLALALRTSGSTGTPRLPAFAASSVLLSSKRIAAYLGLANDDVVALLLPCDHGFGLVGQLLAAASVGAKVVWCGRAFAEERARAVADARASVVAGVPFGLAQLVDHLGPAAHLRQVGSAGGPLAPALAHSLAHAFPHATLWNQYGCTEAGPRLTAMASTDPALFEGSVGRPIEGVSVWLDDDGVIAFASDTQMQGYLGDDAATAAARRDHGFTTGDLGVFDDDGRLHITGRVDDIVKVRGERVSLEAVARAVEGAGADAAMAVVDDDGIVVVYEGAYEVRPAMLARAGVVARRMLWVPALPRLDSGKLDRTTIETMVRA